MTSIDKLNIPANFQNNILRPNNIKIVGTVGLKKI